MAKTTAKSYDSGRVLPRIVVHHLHGITVVECVGYINRLASYSSEANNQQAKLSWQVEEAEMLRSL